MTTIAIINANDELIDILSEVLRRDGHRVVSAHSRDVREGRLDLGEWLRAHDVGVLLYDIALPYDQNWEFVEGLRARPDIRQRRLILTTTNRRALEQLVGPKDVIEVVGKPFDLEQIREAVRRAVSGSAVSA